MKKLFITLLTLGALHLNAQVKIGDNPTSINPNSLLELESTSKGFLLPRMTTMERDAITQPSNALLIYNTTEGCINIFNETVQEWRSICANQSTGSAVFEADCSSLVISGTYTTGVELIPEENFLTLNVQVTEVGNYNIVANSGGMFFAAAGEFLTEGSQVITLRGQGFPLVSGVNFLGIQIGNKLCTSVVNVANGIAVVTGCGTLGSLTGEIFANETIQEDTVFQSYTAGPVYTGGSSFGITSSPSNGIRISKPVNGVLNGTGAPIDYILSGKPELPGFTTLSYSINGFSCSFNVPVLSGTGRATSVTCGGATAGAYQVGTPMNPSNTKVVTLLVTVAGTFYIRTNTVNGVYFEGSVNAVNTGTLNVTLTAVGTPQTVSTSSYTVTVNSIPALFTSCNFTINYTLPSSVPAFNTISCTSFSVTASYIKANNTGAGDSFGGQYEYGFNNFGKGAQIAADGLTMVVGAQREDGDLSGGNINATNNNNRTDAGTAYIYTRANISSNWTFQAKLKPTVLDASDVFGNAVAISSDGNTVVIGARAEDGSGTGVNPTSNNSLADAGAAYVFVRTGTTWSQQAYLKSPAPSASDRFGCSVTISGDGNTVAVGAVSEDGSGTGINPTANDALNASGAVYTFTRSGSTWSYEAYIKASNAGASDLFGVSIALNSDGTTLAVGAYGEDSASFGINSTNNNSATDAGAAYVFQKTAGVWAQQAYVKASNTGAGDYFGISVSLDASGNVLVVGAELEDGNGTGVNPGANNSASNAGAAYVFNRAGTTWTQTAYLKAINAGASDQFGNAVAISANGEFILVGAPYEDGSVGCVNPVNNNTTSGTGAAYLYSFVGGQWVYGFTYKMHTGVGLNINDFFGHVVSISSNGRSVLVGAYGEDGSGSGINPAANNSASAAGAVIVYTRD
ncbi:hypothetical protein CHU92_11195 [Flavobacterium cyanobacteriorum]|uniref:Integrin n=1 Tax=Flavobacterium cyanobacteriorum TaxID=2022802 RepID=A0A255Z0U0_9FLAO|nr:FG-GAP repeat protein [Flavobacterium cyanobacteriorum]OYQ35072.1 hypothetical protein CHU92_11195 [Flavobacterium cyanobacteriorum]